MQYEQTDKRDKGKVRPITRHQGLEGKQRYIPTLSLTSALEGVGG